MRVRLVRGNCRLLSENGLNVHVLFLSLIQIMYSYNARTEALKCLACDKSACPPAPNDCPRGTILDVCKCCQVCGNNVNESCGGPFGIWGNCGEGLECALFPKIGGTITGSEKGICREIIPKNCEKVKCDIAIKRKCPADSTLVQKERGDNCCKTSYQCVCNKNLCKKTLCAPGFESVLHEAAQGHPGACCDQYVCQPSEKCRSVICPWTQAVQCPSDSHLLPSIPTQDGCCYQPQGCECNPCPPVLCATGLRVQILKEARKVPGQCCTKFQCVNETNLSCHVDLTGETYADGKSWKPSKCVVCTCRRGLTFCKQESCRNVTVCPYMEFPEGSCCPVCKGCLTESGDIVNNSATWNENDCTTCTCVNGKSQCKSQMCQTKCSNPRKIPGKCCPVCEDDDSTRQKCPDLQECSLICPSGFQYTETGCYMCKCKPANCYLDCQYGYKRNSKGEEICECVRPWSKCPPLDNCKKQCTYGFKVTKNGCSKCSCNKCPLFVCNKRCVHGYLENRQGCQLCKCKGKPPKPQTVNNSTSLSVKKNMINNETCLSAHGQRYDVGESWYDGCRLCHCLNGQEMCSVIACPTPACGSPVFRQGDCCPSCSGAEGSDKSATIIIFVLAILVVILLLLFVFFTFKYHRRRQSSSKKYNPSEADMENIKPVQVKLLGYGQCDHALNNSDKIWEST